MRILPASDRAVLVEVADIDAVQRVHRTATGVPGVVESIPAARTVLVRFDPLRASIAELAHALAQTGTDAAHFADLGEATIPVQYDGGDLDEVAALLGVSVDEVVGRHIAATWRVAFSGFAPGFGYAVGDDPLFDVPRRASPRTRVPMGSVALAGAFTGVYPRESPGGWQLIGRTDAVMWDIDRDPPALLSPGMLVRFARAEREVVRISGNMGAAQRPSTALDAKAAIEIIRPALQLLIQDRGRTGHAALGVSSSGAADRTALRDANRAVGNAIDAAALEGVGGFAVAFRGDTVAAVAGARGTLTLTDAAGLAREVAHGIPFAVVDGDHLHLAPPVAGLRYVLAVRGGILAPQALGSSSTDTLAGLGPVPLGAADVAGIGASAPHAVAPEPPPRSLPASGDVVEIDITLGPREDWFTAEALRTLTSQQWLVTPRSDRVGIRLHGDVPLERAVTGELPSEGAVTGAIQVPPDGQPVLFLPDHPLTGGYPIIGAVTDRCLDLAGQLPPGSLVHFRVQNPPTMRSTS